METPRSDTYNDIYFCEEDGLAEGFHVFLKGNKLPENWAGQKRFVIAETGFGTGLNFLASWLAWDRTATPDQHLTYISFEKFPLSPDRIENSLSRWKEELGGRLETMLENYPPRIAAWHNIKIAENITLLLIFDDVNRALPELDSQVDAWFLDGFAPAKNPEMWSETVFAAMAKNSHAATTVASFTAAGLVKNGLRAQGFHIAKTRGFGRKRDMIYGHYEGKNKKRDLPDIQSVAVIGAGLAGVNAAAELNAQGLAVDLYEEREPGARGSGNPRGLFNPRFTSQRGTVSDFYATAFSAALRKFKTTDNIDYKDCGSIHLLTDAEKEKRLRGAADNWNWHDEHMRVLSAEEASEIAGIKIEQQALYLPDAGSVSPVQYCREMAKKVNLISERVDKITQRNGKWIVNERLYDAVVVAAGEGVERFVQTNAIPFHTVRGQLCFTKATEETAKIKTNICYGGYCTPGFDGWHSIGSTFQPWLKDTIVNENDNRDIIENFENKVPALSGEMKAYEARAALRVSAKDRFPVIGEVPGYEGLYISAGHGSHGLTSSLTAAEIITAQITSAVVPVPASVLTALSAQRFIDREAKKPKALLDR